jgi:hypothetical protein
VSFLFTRLAVRFAGGFEFGIRTWTQRDWNDVSWIWDMRVLPSLVHTSIRLKRAGDAAVIVPNDGGISPLPAYSDRRSVIGREVTPENGPVIHTQIDLLAIRVRANASAHSAT